MLGFVDVVVSFHTSSRVSPRGGASLSLKTCKMCATAAFTSHTTAEGTGAVQRRVGAPRSVKLMISVMFGCVSPLSLSKVRSNALI